MIDLREIQRVNNDPLNQAAGKWLPPDLRKKDRLNVLALIRWGLENGLGIKPPSPDQPTQEDVEQRLQMLERWPPLEALRYIQKVEGEQVLDASELANEEDAMEAASLLLQTLYGNMVANRA